MDVCVWGDFRSPMNASTALCRVSVELFLFSPTLRVSQSGREEKRRRGEEEGRIAKGQHHDCSDHAPRFSASRSTTMSRAKVSGTRVVVIQGPGIAFSSGGKTIISRSDKSLLMSMS